MKYASTVLDLIGNTPLVKLNSVTAGIDATILVKLEYLNPGGSIKDRISLKMVERAEAEGLLQPGGTIVEPTSGNTGVGLAMVGQLKGYKTIFVTPDKVGEEKRDVLRAYGAEVVVTPTAVAPDSPESYYGVSDRLVREIEGAYKPDQFSNPAAPDSHYESTGPEIWNDTDGTLTHVVIGAGTGGTITGTGRYLKEISADRASGPVKVIGADPDGSVYSGGTGRPYFVEGVGEDMWPGNYDASVPDEIIAVTDADAFSMTRRLAKEEGLLVGGSSGMAVVAALAVAKDLPAEAIVVVILPDGGRGYLGKIFNDNWMRSYGFLRDDTADTVGALLTAKPTDLPDLVHTHMNETVRDAVAIMNEYGVSALPVLSAEPPVRIGEVRGYIDERTLTEKLFRNEIALTDPVGPMVTAALPLIGIHETIDRAKEQLSTHDALLVTDDGAAVGVITRHDLLTYLTH
ncbi:cystathionine beta-synthase [Paeniglutamicibacter sp. Y32M11]|uniref:cystathionine beta-synthase n=1 Tax=Paeniglutamicibacter sp. Y32M11 TaxID=2853258 RepID=UPI001052F7D7|nr:cystathionine beta-synthase [Paeniglutamicibacter sp. Y32M11]QXQ09332.1 cystathionine beta-synthase [Paeniglutamicibacter sp. Y32M11]